RRKMGNAINRMRRRQQVGRAQLQAFHDKMPKVLVEARSPDRPHGVAWLKHGPQARTSPSAHQAEMAAMVARQQFKDGGRFAVAPRAKDDAVIGPFQSQGSLPPTMSEASQASTPNYSPQTAPDSIFGKFQPHLPIALGVIAPVFPDLHEQEEVDRRLDHLRNL